MHCIYFIRGGGRNGYCTAGRENYGLDSTDLQNYCTGDSNFNKCPRYKHRIKVEKGTSKSDNGVFKSIKLIAFTIPILFWLVIFSIVLNLDEGVASNLLFIGGGSIFSLILGAIYSYKI